MQVFHQYFDIFGEKVNRELYEMAIGHSEKFDLSKTSFSKLYPEWRKSKVIFDNLFTTYKLKIEKEILSRFPRILEVLEMEKFSISSFEVQLTSHNDGDYYRVHRDNKTPQTIGRTITFVYYFYGIPRKFDGGELTIYNSIGEKNVIEPVNDSIVFFNSGTKHEVNMVHCPSKKFEDGRFTLNGWVRNREYNVPNQKYFGYNIFQPVSSTKRKI